MLILRRRKDESIMIGDDVEIIAKDIQDDKVGLKIMAPDDVPILMKEIWDAIQRKNGQKKESQDQQGTQEPVMGATDRCAPVLFLKRDDSIMIGDDVEIIIVGIIRSGVRLGITAPKEIPVHRREVYDAIQREKEQKKK